MSTDVEKKRPVAIVVPFVVEMTDPRCGDIIIQSIPGTKLRSMIKSVKEVFSPLTAGPDTMSAPSGFIPGLPELPGMRIQVTPSNCKYEITDPLHGDKETCALIQALRVNRLGIRTKAVLDGVPPIKGKLEPSRMKTLVRELLWMVETGMAKVVKGVRPEIEEIEKLPGRFLLNPGSTIPNLQPRYEEDMQEWVDNLARVGG